MSYKTSTLHLKDSGKSHRNNYLQSCPYPRQRQALLSIKPEFAEEIFQGRKKYEFRRSIFKRSIDVVVVYVTSPVMKVIGEFDVENIIQEPIENLWRKTKHSAGIDENRFMIYFDGKDDGYALEIGKVRIYDEPLDLKIHFGVRPPQSYMYLDFTWPIMNTEH